MWLYSIWAFQMSAYATIYAMSKDFNLDMVILKSQFDQLHPFFPNVSEDLVVEKRFCDHCAFKWILKKPAWFRFARQRKALVRKGLAITLTAVAVTHTALLLLHTACQPSRVRMRLLECALLFCTCTELLQALACAASKCLACMPAWWHRLARGALCVEFDY